MKINYYTLMIDWDKDGNYSPEFGDWDRAVVQQERTDSFEGERFKIEISYEETGAAIEYIKVNNPFKKKIYRVKATMETYIYVDVKAFSSDEAVEIAKEIEGSEFIDTGEGCWIVDPVADVIELNKTERKTQ